MQITQQRSEYGLTTNYEVYTNNTTDDFILSEGDDIVAN